MQSRWWHYTTSKKLVLILTAGRIERATSHVGKGERKAIWFSSRPTWEPTATKLWRGKDGTVRQATIPEMVASSGPLVRIEVNEARLQATWAEHRLRGGVPPAVADGLEVAAREMGADPADWRVSYHDIALKDIVSVESSKDGETWVLVDLTDPRGVPVIVQGRLAVGSRAS